MKKSKSKLDFVKNVIINSVLKEPQPTSNLNKDRPRKSWSKKRNLSSSPEQANELKSTQKALRKRKKKKKKKKNEKKSQL